MAAVTCRGQDGLKGNPNPRGRAGPSKGTQLFLLSDSRPHKICGPRELTGAAEGLMITFYGQVPAQCH